MALRIACRTCGTAFLLDDSFAGKKVRCRECRDVIAVPKPAEPEPIPVLDLATEPEPPLDPEAAAAEVFLGGSAPRRGNAADDLPVLQLVHPPPTGPEREIQPASSPRRQAVAEDDLPVLQLVRPPRAKRSPPGRKWHPVHYVVVLVAGGLLAAVAAFAWMATPPARPPVAMKPAAGPNRPPRPLAAFPEPLPVPITPAPIEKETAYALPEPAATLRVGGGGRYLILHLAQARKLAIFDVSAARIVRDVPVEGTAVVFAAGMHDLLVCDAETRGVQRYDLATGQLQARGRLSLPPGQVKAFCLGHASAGPLLVNVQRDDMPAGYECSFFDPATFEALGVPEPTRFASRSAHYGAGASGRLFSSKEHVLRLDDSWSQANLDDGLPDVVVPGPDDRHVYPLGRGVLDTKGNTVPNATLDRLLADTVHLGQFRLPAVSGPYYLHAQTPIGWPAPGEEKGSVRLHRFGTAEPLATFSGVPLERFVGGPGKALEEFGVENSVHWIPPARLLVVVPPSRGELRLYPAPDVTGSGPPRATVLEFTTPPPTTARRGETFAYTPTVVANRPPVTFRLEGAPTGMKVGDRGQVTFDVPALYPPARIEARLIVRDTTGRDVEQALRLDLGELPAPSKDPILSYTLSLRASLPLPAPFPPVEIRPAAIDRPVMSPLPDAAGSVCLGGGGRYLVLHLPGREEAAVFDVSAAKIVRTLPAKGRDVHVAAGRDELVAYDHATSQACRYRLEDGTPLGSGKLDLPEGPVESFCLGHASAGPLLASVRGQYPALYDLATLKPLDLTPWKGAQLSPRALYLPAGRYEAGPNGRLFACRVPGQVCTIRLYQDRAVVETRTAPVSYAVPGLDDRLVFLGGRGIADEQLSRQEDTPPPALRGNSHALVATAEPYLPAAHGPYYFRLEKAPGEVGRVCWFALGSKEPLTSVEPDGLPAYSPDGWNGLPVEQSFHLFPGAKVLVAVAESRRELRLFPADPEGTLVAKAPLGCIFTSPAIASVQPGTTWTYQATVRGKHSKIIYTVFGAPGATVDQAGRIIWAVPQTPHNPTILTLVATDATARSFRHTIRLEPDPGR